MYSVFQKTILFQDNLHTVILITKIKRNIQNVFLRPVNNDVDCREHHFRFPEWLPEYFINNFSNKGDLIYDCFLGSGTTAKMAIKLDRNFIGSEISKDYCNMAQKRINKELLKIKIEF